MKNQTTTTKTALTYSPDLDPQTARRLCQQAVKTMLRSVDRATPTPLTHALLAAAAHATHSATREEVAAATAEYLEQYAEQRDRATDALLHAKRLTITEDERDTYTAEYTAASAERDSAKAAAEDAAAVLQMLTGDFDDLAAAALLQYYITLVDPAKPSAALLTQYGYTPEDWQSADTIPADERGEIFSRAQYKSMIAAARAAMGALSSISALDSWHTDTTPLLDAVLKHHNNSRAAAQAATLDYWRTVANNHTSPTAYPALDAGRAALAILDTIQPDTITDNDITAAALDYWRMAYGDIGNAARQHNKDGGYTTIEFLPATKHRAAGLYKVTRRPTIRAAQSLDEMQQAGTAPAGIDSAALKALDDESADSRRAYLAALMDAANLTPRARAWIAAYTGAQAQQAAEAAGNTYAAHRRKWDTNRRAAYRNAQHRAAMDTADRALNLSPAAAQKMHKRLFDRLAAAAKRVTLTDTGRARRDSRAESIAIRAAAFNRRPISYSPAEHCHTMAQDTRRPCWLTTNTTSATPVVDWISAEQADSKRAARAAAAAKAAAASTIDNTTPDAQTRAAEAAERYNHKHAAKIKRKAAAERRAAIDAIRAAYPTLDEWRSMTRAERDTWISTH